MQIAVDIPESMLLEAEARGLAVETLVQERLNTTVDFSAWPGFAPFGEGKKSAAEAADDIRNLSTGQTLGGEITIAQLIEEGRRP